MFWVLRVLVLLLLRAPLITGAGMVLISGSNTSPALTSDLAGTAGANWSEVITEPLTTICIRVLQLQFAYEVLGASSADHS